MKNWRDIILLFVMGKYFMGLGVIAFFVVLFYDFIVQRPFSMGEWQSCGLILFLIQIWFGYELDRFTFDLRMEGEDYGI